MLRVSKNTVYEYIYTGRLRAIKMNKSKGFKISEQAILDFIKTEEEKQQVNSRVQ